MMFNDEASRGIAAAFAALGNKLEDMEGKASCNAGMADLYKTNLEQVKKDLDELLALNKKLQAENDELHFALNALTGVREDVPAANVEG